MVDGQRDWLTFYERCQYRTYYWKVVVPGEFPFDVRRIHRGNRSMLQIFTVF